MWMGCRMWARLSILVKDTTARWTVPQVSSTRPCMSAACMLGWHSVSGQPHRALVADVDEVPYIAWIYAMWPWLHCDSDLCTGSGKAKTGNLKGEEIGMVEQIAIVGTSDPSLQRANILMRLNRNPVIGDKFSSRHGQKGVLSQQWPDINMPVVASTGMR